MKRRDSGPGRSGPDRRKFLQLAGSLLGAAAIAPKATAGELMRTAEQHAVETIEIRDFTAAAREEVLKLMKLPIQQEQFMNFCKDHEVEPTEENFRSYMVAKMNYEAFRSSGFLRFGYQHIDRGPTPNATIEYLHPDGFDAVTGATGQDGMYSILECDTGAAFYAYVTQQMGVDSGVMWPMRGHALAYSHVGDARVTVPITHRDLGPYDSFGTETIPQRNIGSVNPRWSEGPAKREIPKHFAEAYMQQLSVYGKASDETLQLLRHARSFIFNGQVDHFQHFEYTPRTEDDKEALRHFLRTEGSCMEQVHPGYYNQLAWLAE